MSAAGEQGSDQFDHPVARVIGNEFAEVAVGFDNSGRSPRLRLEDAKTGRIRYLDALELETIIWISDARIDSLLDPSADRWKTDGD